MRMYSWEWLKQQSPEIISAWKASLTKQQLVDLKYDWRFWARDNQLPPEGAWKIWMLLAGRGFGKALALDTPVPTPGGWTTMGALKAGDFVFDEAGGRCRVLAVHPIQIGRPCSRVVFSDGSSIIADEDHLWTTIDRRTRKALRRRVGGSRKQQQCQPRLVPQTLTTAQIAASLYDGKEVNHAIPCAGPLDLPTADLPVDPYVLGAWLGDGTAAAAEITTADPEILEHIEAAGVSVRLARGGNAGAASIFALGQAAELKRCATTGRMVSNGSLHSILRETGLLNSKHIPPAYLRASAEQRLALLQGLMDTDGYCSPAGAVEFCSTNLDLARGAREIALSLGFKAVMYDGRATLNGRDCGPKYRVCFQAHSDRPIFRLKRKLGAQRTRSGQADRGYRRYITAIELVASVPVRCITVDSPSRLYLVGEAMIPTHNTRIGAETIRMWATASKCRIHMIAKTAADTRDVMLEGESGLLTISHPQERPHFEPSKRRVTWPNGSTAILFSAEEPDALRGPQAHYVWADEVAAWPKAQETFDQIMFGLRLGKQPRMVITTTPRPIKLIKDLLVDPDCHITRGKTRENAENIDISRMEKAYAGTRLGRQELDAEILEDTPGALWNSELIEEHRIKERPEDLERIVVAIDPAVTSDPDKSDETGIVVVGKIGEHGYVLADHSGHYKPEEWARKAIALYKQFDADRIVAEVNNGGDMVEATLRMVDPTVSYRPVRASRGKVVRAEPVSALYEQGRMHHVGVFNKLEDQMCSFTTDLDRKASGSPDRVDALVWACTDLIVKPIGSVQTQELLV